MAAALLALLLAAAPADPQLPLAYQRLGPSAQSTARPPLLVLLHGYGDSEAGLLELAKALDPRFLALSVRAPQALPRGGFAWFGIDFEHGAPAPLPGEVEQAIAQVARFVAEAVRAFDADPGQVYLLGFSQGAMTSLAVALRQPESVAGAVLLSGSLLPEAQRRMAAPAALAGLHLFVAHGTRDNVLPIAYGRAARDALRPLPVDLTYWEFEEGHHVTGPEVEQVKAWLKARLDAAAPSRLPPRSDAKQPRPKP